MDPIYVFLLAIAIVISWMVMYFVIKGAVKAALHEDRLFQRQMEEQRAKAAAQRSSRPAHLDEEGV